MSKPHIPTRKGFNLAEGGLDSDESGDEDSLRGTGHAHLEDYACYADGMAKLDYSGGLSQPIHSLSHVPVAHFSFHPSTLLSYKGRFHCIRGPIVSSKHAPPGPYHSRVCGEENST